METARNAETGSLLDVPRHQSGIGPIRDWKRRYLGEIRCGTMKRCRHGFQRLSLYHTTLVVLLANQPPAVVSAAFQQRIQASLGVQRGQCQTSGLHHKFERPPVLWSFDAQQIDADSSADLLDIRNIPNVTEYVQSLREKARVLREEALLLEVSLQQSSAARAAQRAQQVDQWIQHLFFDESNQDKNESSALNRGAGSETSNTSEASTPSAQATKQWYKRFRIPDQLPYWARKLQWKAASRRYRQDVISFQPFISGEFDARIEQLKTKLADGKYSGPQLMRVLDRLWELQKPPVSISNQQVVTDGNRDRVTITLQIGDEGNNTLTGSWNVTEAQKLRFCINDLIFASQQLDEAKTTEQPGRLSNALVSHWKELRRADELNFHRNLAATVHDAMQIADANRTSIEDYIRQTWNSTGVILSKPNATASVSVNVTQMMNPSATTPLWIPTSLLPYVLTCPDRVTSDDIRTMREKVLGTDFFCTSLEKIPNAVIFRGNANALRTTSTKSIRSAMAASNGKKKTGRHSALTRIAIQAKGRWIEIKNDARARKERRIASRWVFSKLQLRMRSTGLAERLQLFFLPDPEWRPSARDAEPPPVIIALPLSAQPGASYRSRINAKGLKVSN
jgi:hypothetical protein